MRKCDRCGYPIRDHYTYCKKCYYELRQPFGEATKKEHKCRSCGATIRGRYSYCATCAKRKGMLDNGIGRMY